VQVSCEIAKQPDYPKFLVDSYYAKKIPSSDGTEQLLLVVTPKTSTRGGSVGTQHFVVLNITEKTARLISGPPEKYLPILDI